MTLTSRIAGSAGVSPAFFRSRQDAGASSISSIVLLAFALLLSGCSGDGTDAAGGGRGEGRAGSSSSGGDRGGGPRGGGGSWGGGPPEAAAAVPVEVAVVERRAISSYIETQGTLEAEREVDLVARISGPIVELAVEEGASVRRGGLLARLDDRELKARAEVSKAALEEARQAWERSKSLLDSALISPQAWEQAVTRYDTARAQYDSDVIQLGYTEIRAPFDSLVVVRYVNFAETVAVNSPLFRISDFDPLLCPIQVPEKDLSRLKVDQEAYLTFEAWPQRRFQARVDRIRPVVDATTGTVRVTLEVATEGVLRPGMFARVFVETERRDGALVIPRSALSLESIGDTVYVAAGGKASRREVDLGFREGDFVEVRDGVAEGEPVVVVGQDGLSDGTPVQVLAGGEAGETFPAEAPGAGGPPARTESAGPPRGGPPGGGPPGGGRFDPSQMTPERLEMIKERMRQRGLSEKEIEDRLKQMRERSG